MTLDLELTKDQGAFLFFRGSFKDVHQVSIALGFHFIVGNEPQGCTVDTVPDTVGGFGIIFKDMAQMGIACVRARQKQPIWAQLKSPI